MPNALWKSSLCPWAIIQSDGLIGLCFPHDQSRGSIRFTFDELLDVERNGLESKYVGPIRTCNDHFLLRVQNNFSRGWLTVTKDDIEQLRNEIGIVAKARDKHFVPRQMTRRHLVEREHSTY